MYTMMAILRPLVLEITLCWSKQYKEEIPFLDCLKQAYEDLEHCIDTAVINETVDDAWLKATISSNHQQYLHIKLYEFSDVDASLDTIWKPIDLAGTNTVFQVENEFNQDIDLVDVYSLGVFNGPIKLECHVITERVASYLLALSEYRLNQSTLNQFQNPPKFFSGNFYVLTYATSIATTTVFL